MGRFEDPQDALFRAINTSLGYDQRLYPEDIEGSVAHAEMLAAEHIISDADLMEIKTGLAAVKKELDAGVFPFNDDDEDIHMAIERRLTELVGDAGAKLHTARSRNDQVATDVTLFTRRRAVETIARLNKLMQAVYEQAVAHKDWAMPGYTHLQRAQSIYLGHHLMAYFWMFQRDRTRFTHVVEAAGALPLGAGAIAGANFETDREMVAAKLGFKTVAPNSMDAVANRDFVLDYLSAATTCATHLSRLGAEIVLWSSEEFGFAEVSDGFASGSSLMPQKKNPDAAELLRGKAPRVLASLTTLHGVMHGLPLTYNKDMQEDKEAVFDTADTILDCLNVTATVLRNLRVHAARAQAAATHGYLNATELADYLARKGMPFREAHEMVGRIVMRAIEQKSELNDLSLEEFKSFSPLIEDDVFSALTLATTLRSKSQLGGTAPARVAAALSEARKRLAAD
jgi:argininosuccinate lyase